MTERVVYPYVVCGWCPELKVLATIEQDAHLPEPKVSHGICVECDAELTKNIEAMERAARL